MTIENEYYSQAVQGPYEVYSLGNFELEMGGMLRDCKLAYNTFGTLNEAKDNAILFPHMYTGTHKSLEIYVGEGMALDPKKYFIIFPDQLGSGVSTSPHNTPPPFNMAAFPRVTIGDDVRAQHQLLTQHFGIKTLQLVLGWSMGAQQTYEWAVRYPDMVKRAAPIAGTAKGTPHNTMFTNNLMDSLKTDPAWNNGWYTEPHAVHIGLRRHARTLAMQATCPEFFHYDVEAWRRMGFSSLEDFLVGLVEGYFLPMDPNDLLCQLWKWQNADVSRNTGGDLKAALERIKAKTFVICFSQDMFFPSYHCEREQKMIANSEFRPIPSLWGHFTMFGFFEEDKKAIDDVIKELLAVPV